MSDDPQCHAQSTIGTGDISGKGIAVGPHAQATYAEHHHYGDAPYDVRGLANPYRGLAAFTSTERANYAGRDQQIAHAVATLVTPGEQRVLLFVTGASGSGKSSFAQAGLLPALEQYYQQRHQRVRHAVFRPSKPPLAMLADALLQLGMPLLPLEAAPASVYQHIQTHTPAQTINLIVIDQFEELFTQSDPAQRDRLFTLLNSPPPFSAVRTHLIATLRADYLPELVDHPALYTQVKDGIELRVMTPEELKQAIQRPLQQHPASTGKSFEAALLERLAHDAAADATYLPLLQVTLASLWAKGTLKLHAYGSLTDAIQQHAEQVATTRTDGTPRPDAEQQALLHTFLDLVAVSLDNDARRDVRRRRTLAELTQERPGWEQTIDELATARLLSKGLEQRAGRAIEVVDIVHESLIGNWERLRTAIASQRDLLQRRVRFELAVKEWQAHNQHDTYLLSGVRLVEAEMLDQQRDVALHDPAAQELRKRSSARRDSERRQQLRRVQLFAAVLGVLLLLALGAAWFAVDRQQAAEAETERAAQEADARATAEANAAARAREAEQQLALATSRQLAAQATIRANNVEYDTALLLGAQAMAITTTLEAQAALLTTLQTEIRTYLRGHFAWVRSVAFSPDGQTLASGSWDGTIIRWDLATGQPHTTLKGHRDRVSSVAFSPDGQTLASGSTDTTIIRWDLATGQPHTTLKGHRDRVSSVMFSPEGQTLASGSFGTIIRWDRATGQPHATLKGHPDRVSSVAFRPDGQTLASASFGTIIRWDLVMEQQQARFVGHPLMVYSLAFRPDGQTLVSGSADETIIVWDVATGQPRATRQGQMGWISSVAFSPDGQTRASGSWEGPIIRWDLATGQPQARLEGHTHVVWSVAFSPDGQTRASGSKDTTIMLWDVATGQPHARLAGHTASVGSVAFSPDGQTLASSSLDGTIIRWDLATGQPRATLTGHTAMVNSVAFSPDGQTLASGSGDRTIILWDVATGQPRARLAGHAGWVTTVAFSPDGQLLAAGSIEGAITLWEVATGQPRPALVRHKGWVTSIAFSPDGQTRASGSEDTTIIRWEMAAWQDQQALHERACRSANRNLTWEEWQRYLPNRPYAQTCPHLPAHPSAVAAGVSE